MDMQQVAKSTAQNIDQSGGILGATMAFENGFGKVITPLVQDAQANNTLPKDQAGLLKFLNDYRRTFAEMVSGADDKSVGMNITVNRTASGELENIEFGPAK